MAEYIKKALVAREIRKLQSVRESPVDIFQAGFEYGVNLAWVKIDKIPAADVAPVVHGGWIPLLESEISDWNPEFAGNDPIGGYMCSVCKEEAIYDCNDEFVLSKFCPYCGAKMDKN